MSFAIWSADCRSWSGMVGEVVVRASTRSPMVSWATLRTKVESTPPEKATMTLVIGAKIPRRVSIFDVTSSSMSVDAVLRHVAGIEILRFAQDDRSDTPRGQFFGHLYVAILRQ